MEGFVRYMLFLLHGCIVIHMQVLATPSSTVHNTFNGVEPGGEGGRGSYSTPLLNVGVSAPYHFEGSISIFLSAKTHTRINASLTSMETSEKLSAICNPKVRKLCQDACQHLMTSLPPEPQSILYYLS